MPTNSPRPTAGRRKRLKPSDLAPLPETVVARPDGLTEGEAAYWDRLAPQAHTMRTLTDETSAGFRLLVETLADRDAARAALALDGLTIDGKVHPIAVHARQLTQRAESLLSRFLLVATARAVDVPKSPEATANPWATQGRHNFFQPLKGTGR